MKADERRRDVLGTLYTEYEPRKTGDAGSVKWADVSSPL